MKEWLLDSGIITESEIKELEQEAKDFVRQEQKRAWSDYRKTMQVDLEQAIDVLKKVEHDIVEIPLKTLLSVTDPTLKEVYVNVRRVIRELRGIEAKGKNELVAWYKQRTQVNQERFNDKLFVETPYSPLLIDEIPAIYDNDSQIVDGREVLNSCFKSNFDQDARLIAFGEDVGKIGDVNQGFAGLQDLFGEQRIFDTGIRESAIIGKGLGLAVRGFRPIAEIQYLDYLIYAMPVLSDDLASLSYRTKGRQKAPLIIRTRGHRLEGIWHSGSPMSVLLGGLRGIHICVPRNMTQAAGMYNTLLKSDEPALVIECLNGYR
ncbi:MAG: transketolase, partial [Sphingobacterium sp.]